ncbi:hypothetical protein [Tsukamurella ocularis]|uniref:hypothetical protein n=1 Tax=Tsukamurella ocularis TaxID=1970234 RepID=UPI0021688620|nr:hypothetical protein [Tsukamurella ocularis]MCS3779710.1 hypothetical protein [Tsukamurella ocularis]MCS3788890.1 hypothetical protein [Tsukamurella ocularis]MCS3850100.1 hypothetical protein [Tsukamurella ocularis]
MPHARTRFAAVLLAMLLAVASCASDKPTPVISQEAAPPAPAALPADWNESTVEVPVTAGAAVYVSPRNPQRLRAALILAGPGRAGQIAARELSVMLAQHGVASLRFDGAPSDVPDYATQLDRAGKGLTALAERAGLGDDRLLAVGHGTAAALALALGTGATGRAALPMALIEPVLTGLPTGTPDVLRTAMTLPPQKHNIVTCSDADVAVDCSATQDLADVMTGTHANYVRLRGVSHALQEDVSRDPARYGGDLPFSATLFRSLGSWVTMQ